MRVGPVRLCFHKREGRARRPAVTKGGEVRRRHPQVQTQRPRASNRSSARKPELRTVWKQAEAWPRRPGPRALPRRRLCKNGDESSGAGGPGTDKAALPGNVLGNGRRRRHACASAAPGGAGTASQAACTAFHVVDVNLGNAPNRTRVCFAFASVVHHIPRCCRKSRTLAAP